MEQMIYDVVHSYVISYEYLFLLSTDYVLFSNNEI